MTTYAKAPAGFPSRGDYPWHEIWQDSDGDDLIWTLNNANSHTDTIIVDLRQDMQGYIDLYLETLTKSNDGIDAAKLEVLPAYLDLATRKSLAASDETALTVFDGLDISTVGDNKQISLTQFFADNGVKDNFLHGSGIALKLTNVGGGATDVATVGLIVGIR